MKVQWYIGRRRDTFKFEAFRSKQEPTARKFDKTYTYCIGPFKTARAAKWAEAYGDGNPHFRTVEDAERIAARQI